MSAQRNATQPLRGGFALRLIVALLRFLVGIALCLHPLTAIVALGWITRRLKGQITALLNGSPAPPWPELLMLHEARGAGRFKLWFGGLLANARVGGKAFTAVLMFTLPVSALWYVGWIAGWENSFNKGYEQAFFWPMISFGAVIVSAPLLTLLPMAIAHQAATNRVAAVWELRWIFSLYRHAPWSNLGLLLMIVIGFVALLGVRALPTFADHISQRVAAGEPASVERYLWEIRLAATTLLFTGLLVLRSAMGRVYAKASGSLEKGRAGGVVSTGICYALSTAIWLAVVFSFFLAQFLNYNWYSWLNQPVLMLPWLGTLAG